MSDEHSDNCPCCGEWSNFGPPKHLGLICGDMRLQFHRDSIGETWATHAAMESFAVVTVNLFGIPVKMSADEANKWGIDPAQPTCSDP